MPFDPVIDTLPRHLKAFRAFWSINPLIVFGVTFVLGTVPLFYAVLISPIGDAAYYMPVEPAREGQPPTVCSEAAVEQGLCIEKHVGYQDALNWWPALLILFPLALYFAFDSVQSLIQAFARIRKDRMFTDQDWSSGEAEKQNGQLHKIVHRLWSIFLIAGSVSFLIIGGGIFFDWFCVVHTPLKLNLPLASLPDALSASACPKPAAHENDWSIAATFGQEGAATPVAGHAVPGWWANYVFSAYVYTLLLVEMGLLLAYYGFVFAFAVTMYDVRRGRFGLRMIPNLRSQDPNRRMGFEDFEPVFRPCVYATIIAFSMAFLMRIQNLYLRDVRFSNIYDFMLGDVIDVLGSVLDVRISTIWSSILDVVDKLQRVLDFSQFQDPQSLLGPPLIMIVLSLVSVALGVILRDVARDGRARVQSEVNNPSLQRKVEAYYGLSKDEILACTEQLQTWPLSWPRVRQSMTLLFMGLFCFVFYRLALIWIGLMAIRAIQGKLADNAKPPRNDGSEARSGEPGA